MHPVDPDYQQKIAKQILNSMSQALREGNLTASDARKAARYVVDRIKTLKSHKELVDLLLQVVDRWPQFVNILKIEQGHEYEDITNIKIAEIEKLIRAHELDHAIYVASATAKLGGKNARKTP